MTPERASDLFARSRHFTVMTHTCCALRRPRLWPLPSRGAARLSLILVCLFACPGALPLWAGDTATVFGTILDASGAVLAGVAVTATPRSIGSWRGRLPAELLSAENPRSLANDDELVCLDLRHLLGVGSVWLGRPARSFKENEDKSEEQD